MTHNWLIFKHKITSQKHLLPVIFIRTYLSDQVHFAALKSTAHSKIESVWAHVQSIIVLRRESVIILAFFDIVHQIHPSQTNKIILMDLFPKTKK